MGLLTTITIHNDALGSFLEDPKKFGELILSEIQKCKIEPTDVPFDNYSNYIKVNPSIHADIDHLYVHYGNAVTMINGYSGATRKMVKKNPEFAKRLETVLKNHLKELRKMIKENENE